MAAELHGYVNALDHLAERRLASALTGRKPADEIGYVPPQFVNAQSLEESLREISDQASAEAAQRKATLPHSATLFSV